LEYSGFGHGALPIFNPLLGTILVLTIFPLGCFK
jgi:hypothetical protein